MKRALSLLIFLACAAQAQSVGIVIPLHFFVNPAAGARSVKAARFRMIAADIALLTFNTADYLTTRYATFPGQPGYGRYCETNGTFTAAPCQINVPRFSAAKAFVYGFSAIQLRPLASRWHPAWYMNTVAIVDLGLTVPLARTVAGNITALSK
jgi:hypothetical protein